MNQLLKLGCLIIYGLGLASYLGFKPAWMPANISLVAAALLVIHALEIPVFMKHIKLYKGPLAVSMLLTVLFGFVHWRPLAQAAKLNQTA